MHRLNPPSRHTSTKVFDGYSTCFRQWKATNTHCSFLHGYGVYFKVKFEGELDERNWCVDFGFAKRSELKIDGKTLKEYLDYMLDHTVIVAKDDPYLNEFETLNELGIIQLRVLPKVGCELFAEHLLNKINEYLKADRDYVSREVRAIELEFFEHDNNSAIAYYKPSNFHSLD